MTGTPSPRAAYSRRDGFGVITLDRPQVNAYEIGLMAQLLDSVQAADADPSTNAVILRSSLPTIFSVGADIKVWSANDAAANHRLVDAARATARAIAQSDKVFIAALNGHALGGGLELAMACDLRFAAEGDYQLGLPEVKLGLMPGNGGTQRLLRLVGVSRALEMITSGESVDPAAALAMGLVDRLLPADDLLDESERFARSLAAGASGAIAAIKRSIREGADLSLEAGLTLEASLSDALYETPDAIEGFRAYIEKRPARFGTDKANP
jgi:enoyl-CoA hydratase/carnithine racemase